MFFERLIRQQKRGRRKSCQLSKTMTRMTIRQSWLQRRDLFIVSEGMSLTREWADTVMTPFTVRVRVDLRAWNPKVGPDRVKRCGRRRAARSTEAEPFAYVGVEVKISWRTLAAE